MFEFDGRGEELMQLMVMRDIANSVDQGTLFRSNTVSSKAFKFYSRMFGIPYLFATLGRPLYDIWKRLDDEDKMKAELVQLEKSGSTDKLGAEMFVMGTTEINPDNMEEGMDETLNVVELQLKCQKVLSQIVRSSHLLPRQLCEILKFVHKSLYEIDPELVPIAMGNFMFLRFINPALVNPESLGLGETFDNRVGDKMRRTLVLISKVLQNLANQQSFGQKERYMEPLNLFIEQNKPILQKFYNQVLESEATAAEVVIPIEVKANALSALHNQIKLNKDKVCTRLGNTNPTANEELKALLKQIDEEYASS